MLFSRFPGSKRNQAKYPIWDGSNFDAVIEPFAGGAAFSQLMLKRGVRSVFLADADPWVRAVYECWLNPTMHDRFYRQVELLKGYFLEEPDIANIICKQMLDDHANYNVPEIAAASLVFRSVTFAGIVRTNEQEVLSINYNEDRLPSLRRKQFQFPYIAKSASISISDHWSKAVDNLKQWAKSNPSGRAIALVDPPYYVPPMPQVHRQRKQANAITPAYPGHRPHDFETLMLCVDAVRCLVEISQVKLMAITNYYSDELHTALQKIDPLVCVQVGGKLNGLNRTRASTTEFIEATWTIGVRQTEQLRLAV